MFPAAVSPAATERWLSAAAAAERGLSARPRQLWLLLCLASLFVSFRWAQRLEPWNSDDIELFQFAVDTAAGRHWLLGSAAEAAAGGHLPHTAFRIGLLPASVLAVQALGATAMAYYVVPLCFSLLGFGILYWVLLRQLGALAALVFAAIHVAWPYELQHASVLLTDLPCAVMGLLSLCLLDASARRGPRGRLWYALLAGLAAWETYLLRNNGLVLLAPAYLVFLWNKGTRWQTVYACGVVLLGVLAQQALLSYRGLGWGYDWTSVRADFAAYAKFLPVYSWSTFLVRQFTYQVSSFGRDALGLLAALLVLGSLLLHLVLLRSERRPLPLAIAAFGLFSWLVFSFSIYERVPGGVRAMVPVNFRFIQPFTYSSLIVWAWTWRALRERATRGAALPARPAWLPLASVALPLVLLGFSYTAAALRLPTYRAGATRGLVQALEQERAGRTEPLSIAGTGPSLQVPRVFCCSGAAGSPRWLELSPAELAALVERNGPELVLRDVPRELESARYLEPEARARYREELGRVEAALWRDFDIAYLNDKYALYARPRPGAAGISELTQAAAGAPRSEPGTAQLLEAQPCRALPDSGGARVLRPPGEGRGRASCEYHWLADRLELATLPGGQAQRATGLVLRAAVDYEPPLSVSLELVQYGEHGQRRQQSTLSPGATHVPIPLAADARSLYVVYRITTRGALDAGDVKIEPVRYRLAAADAGPQG